MYRLPNWFFIILIPPPSIVNKWPIDLTRVLNAPTTLMKRLLGYFFSFFYPCTDKRFNCIKAREGVMQESLPRTYQQSSYLLLRAIDLFTTRKMDSTGRCELKKTSKKDQFFTEIQQDYAFTWLIYRISMRNRLGLCWCSERGCDEQEKKKHCFLNIVDLMRHRLNDI